MSKSTPATKRVTPKRGLRTTTVVAQRYTISERVFFTSAMKMYNSPSLVQKLFAKNYQKDPPSRLTIRRIHEIATGSVSNNFKGVAGPKQNGKKYWSDRKVCTSS